MKSLQYYFLSIFIICFLFKGNFAIAQQTIATSLPGCLPIADMQGVIFLSGVRHHLEISKMVTTQGNQIYDIASSAITLTSYNHTSEPNHFRVSGSIMREEILLNLMSLVQKRIEYWKFILKIHKVKNCIGISLNNFHIELG